jgi:hypothetical protein
MSATATELLIWDLYTLDDKLTHIVAERGHDFYPRGTEIHSKLRKAKKNLDAIQGEDIEPAKMLMRHVTNRLLNEVFSIPGSPMEAPVDPATLPARPTTMPVAPAPTCVDCGSRNIAVR